MADVTSYEVGNDQCSTRKQQHWHCFQGSVGDAAARQGGAHMGLSESDDNIKRGHWKAQPRDTHVCRLDNYAHLWTSVNSVSHNLATPMSAALIIMHICGHLSTVSVTTSHPFLPPRYGHLSTVCQCRSQPHDTHFCRFHVRHNHVTPISAPSICVTTTWHPFLSPWYTHLSTVCQSQSRPLDTRFCRTSAQSLKTPPSVNSVQCQLLPCTIFVLRKGAWYHGSWRVTGRKLWRKRRARDPHDPDTGLTCGQTDKRVWEIKPISRKVI